MASEVRKKKGIALGWLDIFFLATFGLDWAYFFLFFSVSRYLNFFRKKNIIVKQSIRVFQVAKEYW